MQVHRGCLSGAQPLILLSDGSGPMLQVVVFLLVLFITQKFRDERVRELREQLAQVGAQAAERRRCHQFTCKHLCACSTGLWISVEMAAHMD